MLGRLLQQSWILDGFPRKLSQAVLLDDLLQSMGEELNFVVSLNVPDEVILSRIEGGSRAFSFLGHFLRQGLAKY